MNKFQIKFFKNGSSITRRSANWHPREALNAYLIAHILWRGGRAQGRLILLLPLDLLIALAVTIVVPAYRFTFYHPGAFLDNFLSIERTANAFSSRRVDRQRSKGFPARTLTSILRLLIVSFLALL